MSQSPPNYMENVPVKISESYKPPPKISLPQSVCQRLSGDTIPCLNLIYDFSLEKNVVQRIEEWKRLREAERDARRDRLRKREIEQEQEQKRLLTAVSYPSAEELSSEDDTTTEELEGAKAVATAGSSSPTQEANPKNTVLAQVKLTPSQQTCFDTILLPTVVPGSTYSPASHGQQHVKTKINYSDFENDTSSPFDNVELKTINDLDILAQVLNVSHLHSKSTGDSTAPAVAATDQNREDASHSVEQQPLDSPQNANHQSPATTTGVYQTTNSDNRNPNDASVNNTLYSSPVPQTQCLQNANHFYTTYNSSSTLQNHVNMNGTATPADYYYYPTSHHSHPATTATTTTTTYDNYMYSNVSYPLSLMSNQNQQNSVMEAVTNPMTTTASLAYRDFDGSPMLTRYAEEQQPVQVVLAAPAATVKSKSKSVPDIVRQLNDEIRDSEIRRTRNNSQTVETFESKSSEPASRKHHKKPALDKTFLKLSPSSQTLVTNISSMGFPLELVSRIAERFGSDDKRIVEHLIPLSELLDLGFDESRISDALLRFDNNKEKALDFLIS